MLKKHYFSVLWSLWMLCFTQGCSYKDRPDYITKILKSEVTITLANKGPVVLYFESLDLDSTDNPKPFRELLEKLERGDREAIANINKPLKWPDYNVADPNYVGEIPLEIAIAYDLGKRYNLKKDRRDEYFNAARFLLEKGADPSTGIHALCGALRLHEELSKRGLVLLLSYGAQLNTKNKEGNSAITVLSSDTNWVPSEQKEEVKKKYFTDVAKELLQPVNNQGNLLDKSFVKYVDKETQVDKKLVQALRKITQGKRRRFVGKH